MEYLFIFPVLIVIRYLFGRAAARIASRKGRNYWRWFWTAFVLGLGVVILALFVRPVEDEGGDGHLSNG